MEGKKERKKDDEREVPKRLLRGFDRTHHPAPSRVRDPSTPSVLLSCMVFVLYLSCTQNENKQKEADLKKEI